MKLRIVNLTSKVPPPPGSRSSMHRSRLTDDAFELEADLATRLLKVTYATGSAKGESFLVPFEQVASMFVASEKAAAAPPVVKGKAAA